MKKKDKIILFASLIILLLVLFVCKDFFADNIAKEIQRERQAGYSECTQNISGEIAEPIIVDQIIWVCVTKYGKKYHREDCRYLRYSKKEMTLENAKRLDYTPCRVCNP